MQQMEARMNGWVLLSWLVVVLVDDPRCEVEWWANTRCFEFCCSVQLFA